MAHGDTPDNIRNHPALKGVPIPRTGRPGLIGTLVTKTLVIAGEGGFVTTPSGQRGAMLRAYDKSTGKDAGAVYMPAPQTGGPMTYSLNGRQYIVVAVGGQGYEAEFLALSLEVTLAGWDFRRWRTFKPTPAFWATRRAKKLIPQPPPRLQRTLVSRSQPTGPAADSCGPTRSVIIISPPTRPRIAAPIKITIG